MYTESGKEIKNVDELENNMKVFGLMITEKFKSAEAKTSTTPRPKPEEKKEKTEEKKDKSEDTTATTQKEPEQKEVAKPDAAKNSRIYLHLFGMMTGVS